jgi:glucose-6-phosphate isomerase
MLNGVILKRDTTCADPTLMYDLTFLPDRPIGWERPKTHGHVHSNPPDSPLGYPEIFEVLEGLAGFMIQDLKPGPSATYAALVTVGPGERVVLPPLLHHAAISLSGDPLVFSDVVSRACRPDYAPLAGAHGMAYLVDLSGRVQRNSAYTSIPPLVHVTAKEWCGLARRPLYVDFVEDPGSLEWISKPDLFPECFPELWARLAPVYSR